MNRTSNSFFHFTSNLSILKSILSEGFYKHYCKEAIYISSKKQRYIGIPMLCFCDIPLAYLSDNQYGKYGIGMEKRWGFETARLSPVHYYPNNGNCSSTKVIIKASESFINGDDDNSNWRILGTAKPFYKVKSDFSKRKNNYLDREWRTIEEPQKWLKDNDPLFANYCEPEREKKEHIGKPIIFNPDKVEFIIVPKSDHQAIIDYIWDDLNKCCGVDLQEKDKLKLISKILIRDQIIQNI